MRVAHALQMPLLRQGGVEVLVRTLIEETPLGDRVVLISQDDPADLAKSDFGHRIQAHLRIPEGPLPESWGRTMANWMVAQRVDLCHIHLSGTYGWAAWRWNGGPIIDLARAGIVTVSTNHSATCLFSSSYAPRALWRNLASATRKWPGKARQLSAVRWEASVSRHDLAVTQRYFPLQNSKLIQIYHSRLDADVPVSPAPASRIILNVGTIAFHKGQHLLVEAFARTATEHPQWQLNLVGYAAEQACLEQIQSIIRKHGLQNRVHLCGPDPDPMHRYEEAEIYVQPSLLEGLGLSLQEAMFQGRACIGSNCGGIPELISDPSLGRLYPAGDVSALARVLSRLMKDPAERQNLGNAARVSILARGMTRQVMSATYHNLYHKAISSQ